MPDASAPPRARRASIRAEGVVLAGGRPPVDLEVTSGSIIGLAGLEGHGQETLLEVLACLRRPLSGRVTVEHPDGERREVRDPRAADRAGIAYLPRDRKREGIFPSMTVLDNFALASLKRFTRLGVLRPKVLISAFEDAKERLGIIVGSERDYITTLSGGNQQKVLLARALALQPSILLLNDPTRGVDANAKASFYEIFRLLAKADGMAIVVLSTEITELVELCERVLVFHAGRLERVCEASTLTEANILAGMFGQADRTGSVT